MAVSVKFAEPRSHAVQKVRNAAASDAGSPVVIQDAELGRSAGSLVPRTRGRQESELPPAPMANLNLVNSSLKGVTPLPDLDQVRSLLKQCGFGNLVVHRFMPGSTFYGIVASQGGSKADMRRC